MNRADYHAARRELYQLDLWLATHRRRARYEYDTEWDAKWHRRNAVRAMLPACRDLEGFGLMAQRWARRRSHVLARVKQRRLEHSAQALDTTGMSPLRAAMARLDITFGGKQT